MRRDSMMRNSIARKNWGQHRHTTTGAGHHATDYCTSRLKRPSRQKVMHF
jgi:hypothetical protein